MLLLGACGNEADGILCAFSLPLLESRIAKYSRWLFSIRHKLMGHKKPYPKHSVQPSDTVPNETWFILPCMKVFVA